MACSRQQAGAYTRQRHRSSLLCNRWRHPDTVSLNLIAPPEYPDAQSILDFIGGSVPEDKFIPIDGGKVKIFVRH